MSDLATLEDAQAFGKLEFDADGKVLGRHLLIDHMIDVAACFCRLARCRSIRRALERSARRKLTEQDIARLAVLVFLHDVGKANSGFQAKRWKIKIPPSWPVQITVGHGVEAIKLFQVATSAEAIEPLIEKICTWGDAADSLLTASISHHGRPIKDSPGVSSNIWKSHDGKYDPAVVLREIAARAPTLRRHSVSPVFAGIGPRRRTDQGCRESCPRVRGDTRGLYVFKHDSELGNVHAHALVERIAIAHKAGVEVLRSFGDYEVTVNEADLPAGVSLIKRV